jgi:UrcA family protein
MNSQRLRRFTISALAITAASLCFGVSVASETARNGIDKPPSVTVHFSDLNVSSPAGAKALYGRIQRAARVVCKRYSAKTLPGVVNGRECYRNAVANAVRDVNQSQLLALHASKTQRHRSS